MIARKIVVLSLGLVCLGHGRRRLESTGPRAQESQTNDLATHRATRVLSELSEFLLAVNPSVRLRRPTFSAAQAQTPRRSDMRRSPTMIHIRRSRSTEVRDLIGLVDQRGQAYDWMANLGAPAALVSGAALASLYELKDDMQPDDKDTRMVSIAKKFGSLLFLSAFAFEIACVFVTTVTGTLLLGKGVPNPMASSAMFMLDRELEFEYLSSRVFFFQGLLNWLLGVGVHQLLPRPQESVAAKRIHKANGYALFSLITYMVAYYNKHISFYANYGAMLARLVFLTYHRFYADKFRLLPVLALLPLSLAMRNMWMSFRDKSHADQE